MGLCRHPGAGWVSKEPLLSNNLISIACDTKLSGSKWVQSSLSLAPMSEERRRRSERLFLTFPIRVEGTGADGTRFAETTRTVVINRHGARIHLKRAVVVGQVLKITHVPSGRGADFRVAGLASPRTDQGGEWGVECLDEKKSIWGIDFPPLDEASAASSVLLECRRCHAVSLVNITTVDYDILESAGAITRECKTCAQSTPWGYSRNPGTVPAPETLPAAGAPALSAAADQATASPAERRGTARVSLRLPIRVRSWQGVTEFTKTENVSKGGLAFATDKLFELGEALQITCPYNPAGDNIEVRSRVVRRTELTAGGRYLYGVEYER
jgi:hypothetical protein